jgi:uncharacterized protein (UPF0332 family)
MTPKDLIASADKLLDRTPSNADVRRAVSTAYYAIFHHISWKLFEAVALPFGSTSPTGGWVKVYRSPDHVLFLKRCNDVHASWGFPRALTAYADIFVKSYKSRIEADYDPSAVVSLNDASTVVKSIERAIAHFDGTPLEQQRAFVLFLTVRPR